MSETTSDLPPHGMRGPAAAHLRYDLWALYAVVLFGVLFLGYWVFTRFNLSKETKLTPTPPTDPVRDLIRQVRDAHPSAPFSTPQAEEYFYFLSSRLRQLIEKVTPIPAAEATMTELKPLLIEKLPLVPSDRDSLISFLDRADQIKYAGLPADQNEAEQAREKVLEWMLQLTRTI